MKFAAFIITLMAIWMVAGAAIAEPEPEPEPQDLWPIVQEFGGATPKNEKHWFGIYDYPYDALRKGQEGNVIVAFDITVGGRATNCSVESSSGFPILDRVPCKRIVRAARFIPATNENGPIATKGRYNVAFGFPESNNSERRTFPRTERHRSAYPTIP